MSYRNLLLFSYHSEQVLSIVLGEERSLFHIIKISEWILGRGWEMKLLISVARQAKFSLNENGEIFKALAKF